ncbi:MAG: hypothetical protein ACTHOE_15280 [Conexibacter sp.]
MEVTMHHTTTAAGVTCASCGAALADDQRYCLHCGQSQGESRVAYRELIAPAVTAVHATASEQPTAVAPPAAAPVPLGAPPRDWTPVIALGGLAALALVLVVGVLIGKSGTQTAAAPAAPQVITVSGAAPAATTPSDTSDTSGSGSGREAKHHARGGGKVSAAEQAAGARAVQDLNSSSGEDYQRKSARLPDTVALPGRPPAADNKPAGGGSGAETIG